MKPARPSPSPLLPPPFVTGEESYPGPKGARRKRRDPPAGAAAGAASPPLSGLRGTPAPPKGTHDQSQPASIFRPKKVAGANAAAGGLSPRPGAADRSRGPRAALRGARGGGPGRGTHLRQGGGAAAEAAAGLGELGPAVAAAAVPAGVGSWRRLMDPEVAGPAAAALLALRLPAERGGRAA